MNPLAADPAGDPGSYNVFNGALGKFDDAYNVFLYAAHNGGAMDMNDADFIGSQTSIDHAQSLGVTGAEQYFLNFGLGDLKGYFGIFPAADSADSAAAAPAAGGFDFNSLLTGEVHGLNSLFGMRRYLAGISPDDIIPGPERSRSTLSTRRTPTRIFDTLVFGFNPANVTPDPGSYDVLNGALGEFANAFNVEFYSLLNAR